MLSERGWIGEGRIIFANVANRCAECFDAERPASGGAIGVLM